MLYILNVCKYIVYLFYMLYIYLFLHIYFHMFPSLITVTVQVQAHMSGGMKKVHELWPDYKGASTTTYARKKRMAEDC